MSTTRRGAEEDVTQLVDWLYALPSLFSLSVNFVTATIGAVSIGVGID